MYLWHTQHNTTFPFTALDRHIALYTFFEFASLCSNVARSLYSMHQFLLFVELEIVCAPNICSVFYNLSKMGSGIGHDVFQVTVN